MKLVDTSAWINFINPKHRSPKNEELRELIKENQAATCGLVHLELQGYKQSEKKAVQLIMESTPVLETPLEVWKFACKVARLCRKSGRPVPNTDVLIYATALHHNCEVFHNDKHFDWLTEIALHKF